MRRSTRPCFSGLSPAAVRCVARRSTSRRTLATAEVAVAEKEVASTEEEEGYRGRPDTGAALDDAAAPAVAAPAPCEDGAVAAAAAAGAGGAMPWFSSSHWSAFCLASWAAAWFAFFQAGTWHV